MSLTALVTGASGFVGSSLVKNLHQQGWNVHVLVRSTSRLDELENIPLTVHQGDIVNAPSVQACMPPEVDAVFHVAASTSVWSGNNEQQEQVNIDGTRHVIEAAIKARAGRFIHTSSFSTWGFQDAMITEATQRTTATDWINYVRTKYLAEKLVVDAVKTGRLDAVILNPGHILGPGDHNNWSRMIDLVNRGKLPGVPPGSGPFADVNQVARAHIQAFHKGEKGAKFLLGGHHASFLDVVRMTGEILQRPVPARATPAWVLKTAASFYALKSRFTGREPDLTPETAAMITRKLLCDSSRAREALDYRFTPVQALIEETIDWMKGKGMLECEMSKR